MENRVLKFRAWDKNTKTMVYSGDNQFSKTNGDIINWFEDEDIMQFTGRQAKTAGGRGMMDVYEGDIVKQLNGHIGEVWFNVEAGRWYIDGSDDLDAFQYIGECELLGNIFSSPNLLTESK